MTTPLTPNQQEVLDGIRDGKLLTVIAQDMGMSKQYVSQLTRELLDAGHLTQPRRGRYLTTDVPHNYRKRPAVHEAIRYTTEDSANRIIDWAAGHGVEVRRVVAEGSTEVLGLRIPTVKRETTVNVGDWVVLEDNRTAGTPLRRLTQEAFLDVYEGAETNG